ncbi:MAG: hypothetical protein PUH90_01005, partial [Clostridia bacterium]|nr:hypothetical protein [Clostridia bacterium]
NYRLCERSEAIFREGGGLQRLYLITLVVGYFADAQYDVKEKTRHSANVERANLLASGCERRYS